MMIDIGPNLKEVLEGAGMLIFMFFFLWGMYKLITHSL